MKVHLRLCVAIGAALVAVVGAGCDNSSIPVASGVVELDLADASAHYEEDFRRHFESEFTARYEGELTTLNGNTTVLDVTWFKDGNRRQRWDTPELVGGEDLAIAHFQIFTEGDRFGLLLCAAELPLNPDNDLGEGETGACYDDPSGASDVAGNAIYFMGFPVEFPDEFPDEYFDALDQIEFTRHWEETIAGARARCYAAQGKVEDEGELPLVDSCYSSEGAELFRHSRGGVQNDVTLRAVSYSDGVNADDFELPYPVVEPDRSDE